MFSINYYSSHKYIYNIIIFIWAVSNGFLFKPKRKNDADMYETSTAEHDSIAGVNGTNWSLAAPRGQSTGQAGLASSQTTQCQPISCEASSVNFSLVKHTCHLAVVVYLAVVVRPGGESKLWCPALEFWIATHWMVITVFDEKDLVS